MKYMVLVSLDQGNKGRAGQGQRRGLGDAQVGQVQGGLSSERSVQPSLGRCALSGPVFEAFINTQASGLLFPSFSFSGAWSVLSTTYSPVCVLMNARVRVSLLSVCVSAQEARLMSGCVCAASNAKPEGGGTYSVPWWWHFILILKTTYLFKWCWRKLTSHRSITLTQLSSFLCVCCLLFISGTFFNKRLI